MDAKAYLLRLEMVPEDTRPPQRSSDTPLTLLVETPARNVSMMASLTEVLRLQQSSMAAVWKIALRGFGTLSSAFPVPVTGFLE